MATGPTDHQARLRAALEAMRKQQARVDQLEGALARHREPIAVVGIGCRFPGGGSGPAAFWERLRGGFDAIREVPADRWPADALYDGNPDAPGRIATRSGGFLDGIDRFDARFFHISPREAQTMDPQQRLLLEVAWEALEHAGVPPLSLAGSPTGVFVGITAVDYAKVIYRDDLSRIDTYCATGNVANIAAGRLSYFFGLRGPSVAMDTACSSSLVALHLACQSLRTGESTMALAAGVNLILAPDNSVAVSRAHMLSPDGRCKAFDRAADGYGRSEGCGVLVLKPLSRAHADGDRVLGLILGSAVRQDGQRAGLTVPNGLAQQEVMRAALEQARVKPAEVGYLEAHGTGTSLGDPIEFEALGAVYGAQRDRARPLVVGSLKTNVGHMESAAGVGGVIKALLTVGAGEIPPHLHFREPNPELSLDAVPAVIPTRAMPWPGACERRLAAVSSFGSSGTIAHVIVAAADGSPAGAERRSARPCVLPLSAKTESALHELASRYIERLSAADDNELADICHTAGAGRSHFDKRLAVVGRTPQELAQKLSFRLKPEATGEGAGSVRLQPADANHIAAAYMRGDEVDWRGVQPGRLTDVPTYPFQRERHWVDHPATIPSLRRGPSWSAKPAASATSADAVPGIRFGIMFFNGAEARDGSDSYRMMLEAARIADEHGLSSVWLPERHFTSFGSLYPNPATLHAALARETSRLRLMAGSVVLPLHNPARIAEEWAVVDNLSGGRVGMSFASGWNPDDFALQPGSYARRQDELFEGVELLRRLWRGEAVPMRNGKGQEVALRTYPTPVQRELPLWITAAGNPETFRRAGAAGANLLTHLLDHDVEELAGKIALYRRARAEAGHDPAAGQVTVMLHTFLADRAEDVHAKARQPYCQYLKENIHLLSGLAASRGGTLDPRTLSPQDLDGFVNFLYDRFAQTRALLGTVDSCAPLVAQLERAGVTEIACLLDFGPSVDDVLAHLPKVAELASRPMQGRAAPTPDEALYEIAWKDVALEPSAPNSAARTFMVREDAGDPAARTFMVRDPDTLLIDWHLDIGDAAVADSLMRVARLVQDLAQRRPGQAPRLWLLTRGAHGPSFVPAQAALWGFAKVLPIEHGSLWGGIIDLDPDATVESQQPLIAGIVHGPRREDQLMIRGGQVRAARLANAAAAASAGPAWTCRVDAAYLVTGGFGGLGTEAAAWLAWRGARHIVLLGRTVRPHPSLRALEEQGVAIEAAAVDIADAGAFDAWLASRPASAPPVRGIVHAAGAWSDKPIAALDEATLRAVLAPKVAGSLTLDRAFPVGTLDLFVAFSAFSSLLPAEGQANYAAANTFMDAVVRRRRARGERALAVNWGPWSGVGFATTEYGRRAHQRLEGLGITRLSPEEGWAWLDRLLAEDRMQAGVMPVDWAALFRADPNARLSPLMADLAARWAGAGDGASAARLSESLAGRDAGSQLATLEQALTTIVAEVIRLERHEIDARTPLTELGLDSLMAVEIKNRIQHECGVDVPLVQLLEGPPLAALAANVLASIKVSALASRRGDAAEAFEEIEL